ncbi:restriction endonuclease subunit S [Bacillus paramycoides]|uniref:restriction endonuclease subunit S n=1 Tax=Bacillus paramycoides TaxID=2026194 RepID=UPI004059C98E
MNAKQLKDSILQYAIEGKLVPRSCDDSSVEVFLENTAKQKSKLINAKILKKDNEIQVIEDGDIPYELPSTWRWVRLGDLFSVTSSKRVKQASWQNEGVPFYRARELVSLKKSEPLKDPIFISNELYAENIKISGRPQIGDILVTGVGTLGITFIVEKEEDFYFKDGNVVWLKNFSGVNSKYISMLFETPFLREQISSQSQGTTVGTLTIVKTKNLLIPLPPMEEQERILGKLEVLSQYISRYKWKFEDLYRIKTEFPVQLEKSILQYAMQGKLVGQRETDEPASRLVERIKVEKERLVKEKVIKKEKALPEIMEDEIPFEIPESWEWVRLLDLVTDIRDVDHWMPKAQSEGYPYISPRDFTLDGINFDDAKRISKEDYEKLSQRIKPSKGDIIFPRYGTIGATRLINVDKEFLVSYSSVTIKINENYMYPKFLYYYTRSSVCTGEIQRYINKTTQPNVGIKSVKSFIVPVPPLDEQYRIVERIEYLLSLKNQLISN